MIPFFILIVVILLIMTLSSDSTIDKPRYISYIKRDDQGRAIKDIYGNYHVTKILSGTNPRNPRFRIEI